MTPARIKALQSISDEWVMIPVDLTGRPFTERMFNKIIREGQAAIVMPECVYCLTDKGRQDLWEATRP